VGASRPLRLGLVGAGYIADIHAQAARHAAGVRLLAACGREPGRLATLADRHAIERRYRDPEALLTDPEVDAVVIALPNALHAPVAIASLEAGKAVLVEKPMALATADAEAMVAAADRAGRPLMVGHMWRFRPEVVAVRHAVASGLVGRPFKTKGYGIHVDWMPSGWFRDPELAGGGALADMGVHALDTAWFVLGEPAPRRVYARVSRDFLADGGADGGVGGVEDGAVVWVEFEGGIASLVEAGWGHPHADGPEAHTQVFGTRGYAETFPPRAAVMRDGRRVWIDLEAEVESPHISLPMYVRQLEHFAAACRGERPPDPDGRKGLQVVRMLEAAYRAAASGRVVDL